MQFTKRRIISGILMLISTGLLLTGYLWLFGRGAAQSRDLQRLADMQALQQNFARLHYDYNTYALAANNDGCQQLHALAHTCQLQAYDPHLDSRRDPGEFAYVVTEVPSADSYAITFILERGVVNANLSAGEHILTPHGIQ